MPHPRQVGSGSRPQFLSGGSTSCSCTGIPQMVESQLGHYTPESLPLWLASLYCQDSPVIPSPGDRSSTGNGGQGGYVRSGPLAVITCIGSSKGGR